MSDHRVIVAGSRGLKNFPLLCGLMDEFRRAYDIQCVVSGTAKGADTMGAAWARRNRIAVVEFPADWEQHGKRAGYLRNVQMAEFATALVAFWDGKSPGTKHMIEIAQGMRRLVEVHLV